jgi:hypothetical protein
MKCKIGTLYINYATNMFIRFEVDDALVYTIADDMNPIGKAKTMEDIERLTSEFRERQVRLIKEAVNSIDSYRIQ